MKATLHHNVLFIHFFPLHGLHRQNKHNFMNSMHHIRDLILQHFPKCCVETLIKYLLCVWLFNTLLADHWKMTGHISPQAFSMFGLGPSDLSCCVHVGTNQPNSFSKFSSLSIHSHLCVGNNSVPQNATKHRLSAYKLSTNGLFH